MQKFLEFRFKIDASTPETLPLPRLIEYLENLNRLLGSGRNAHLVDIRKGSTVPVVRVDNVAAPQARERVRAAAMEDAPLDVKTVWKHLNDMLAEDEAKGILFEGKAEKVLVFPGRDMAQTEKIGPIRQSGDLDGLLIRIGGKGDPVPALVETDSGQTTVWITRVQAKVLAQYLFDVPLRFHGTGRWYRNPTGGWVLENFQAERFSPLDDAPMSSIVAKLRSIGGGEWEQVVDPLGELERIRGTLD